MNAGQNDPVTVNIRMPGGYRKKNPLRFNEEDQNI